MRVLLGQLGANGDCLYATTLARQIKTDYPDCSLTWAVASKCAPVLDHNPDIDELWQWEVDDWANLSSAWAALERRCLSHNPGATTGPDTAASGQFDRIWLSQIVPGNIRHFDGTVRPSILRAYGAPITVEVDSTIRLSDAEHEQVDAFVNVHRVGEYEHRILFECSSKSGQSYVTPEFAVAVARAVAQKIPNICFILSTHETVECSEPYVFTARSIGMRANAALTAHCSMFVGCGSGLTVVATSTAATPIPNLQLLKGSTSVYASFCHDFEYFGKSTERFIEMADAPVEHVAKAIIAVCDKGLPEARSMFHRPLAVQFSKYLRFVERWGLGSGRYADALQSIAVTCDRYGQRPELIDFARKRIVPRLYWDPVAMDRIHREQLDQILERLGLDAIPRRLRRF